jgi:hypothetical protein
MKTVEPELPDADLIADKVREIAHHLGSWPNYDDGIFFHQPSAKLASPYNREKYILKQVRNKRVLHFGFADAPFTEERFNNGSLLHLKIKGEAALLWGADIDETSTSLYTTLANDTNTWVFDICAQMNKPEIYDKKFDLIVFGEILEHLKNPGDALENLQKICSVNNAKLVLTTPNAFNSAGFVSALLGHEIVHPEHYYYYSPVTLTRLLEDCGFKDVHISFYAGDNTSGSPGLTFPGLIAECHA